MNRRDFVKTTCVGLIAPFITLSPPHPLSQIDDLLDKMQSGVIIVTGPDRCAFIKELKTIYKKRKRVFFADYQWPCFKSVKYCVDKNIIAVFNSSRLNLRYRYYSSAIIEAKDGSFTFIKNRYA